MLEDLLSLGVREDGSLRDPEVDEFQETERGRIPVSWTISRIDELSQSNVGIVVTPAKYYTNSGILV
ncbi:restriction endonuclease subunit S, partial [Deltaproteobacteria bacterium]|nr:restriction endonuclease subunit S [Deltaproteobacteria bacterium]